jgi:hypothetical protein
MCSFDSRAIITARSCCGSTSRSHNRGRVPVLYGRVVSCVSEGGEFADTHACLVLTSKRLRGVLDMGAEVGDTVAVQVVALTSAGTPLYRYGVKHAGDTQVRW